MFRFYLVASLVVGALAHGDEDHEHGENAPQRGYCELEPFYEKGFKVKSSRPPVGDKTKVAEGQTMSIECADNFVDNMFEKKSTRATCICKTNEDEKHCWIEPKQEGFRCISLDVCPLPIWQGAKAHTVKDLDDDWALLSFKLRKDQAISKHMKDDFSWSEYIPNESNWTIVLACPFNVLGVQYDKDPERDDLEEMIDEGVRMMKDCRGDHMLRSAMQRNEQRRVRKEKKMARLARKAAREGRHARRYGDFTDKMCQVVKEDEEKKEEKLMRMMGEGYEKEKDNYDKDEYDGKEHDKCPCDKKTWRGRKYMGKISSLDGRVTSSTTDGRMWTIVSKGAGGVRNGAREFKIAIDMLNGVNPLKWVETKELKSEKKAAAQYTCELGIVPGHYPHLAPCLNKFHQLDIYRYMKDYPYMRKNDLLPEESEYQPNPEPRPTQPDKDTNPDKDGYGPDKDGKGPDKDGKGSDKDGQRPDKDGKGPDKDDKGPDKEIDPEIGPTKKPKTGQSVKERRDYLISSSILFSADVEE